MMNREDAYYIPEDDDYPSEELEWEVEQLMQTDEFNPHKWGNFNEAFAACQNQDDIEFLEQALERRDFEALGRKLWCMSFEYWEGFAVGKITGQY
jgi:hypothetical protein